jgi:hypothetical protein
MQTTEINEGTGTEVKAGRGDEYGAEDSQNNDIE